MTHPGFSETYQSAGTRAKVATGFLAITGLVALLTAFHDVAGFDLVSRAELGTVSSVEATQFDETTQGLAGAYLLAFLGAAIAYLAWLSRSVDNVPKLSGELPKVTPRWSIGWWFVPIANLWKPYQIVKDIHSRLATESRSAGGGTVLAWWIAWITGGVVGTLVSRLPEPSTFDELSGWFGANLIADVVGVAAAVLAIIVLRRIQARADERSAGLEGHGTTAPQAVISSPLQPCPRCGSSRQAGQQICPTCGLDLWAAYDQGRPRHGADE